MLSEFVFVVVVVVVFLLSASSLLLIPLKWKFQKSKALGHLLTYIHTMSCIKHATKISVVEPSRNFFLTKFRPDELDLWVHLRGEALRNPSSKSLYLLDLQS